MRGWPASSSGTSEPGSARGDPPAGHTAARGADRLAAVVVRAGVDHQRGTVGIEQPLARAPGGEADAGGEQFGADPALFVGVNVREVAVVGALRVKEAVRRGGLGVVDVAAGRGEG